MALTFMSCVVRIAIVGVFSGKVERRKLNNGQTLMQAADVPIAWWHVSSWPGTCCALSACLSVSCIIQLYQQRFKRLL